MDFKGFALDPFQEQAIRAVEEGRSVIVSAPTGAGKTVIAEYAIEKAIASDKQIIYTAPIKALSNQKYRDFTRDYKDKIGIMTGDVIINPEAPVLIMTTEIFRNIIFDSEEQRLRDISTVIFDEIHYINDIQRGTVWEESIIFAPQHIRFICLSATIPNFMEFAEWMRSVREAPIEAVVETQRPVPLKIELWVPGAGFRDLNYIKKLEKDQSESKKLKRTGNVELVHHLKREKQLPCLYFHFSRVGCEEYAQHFRGAGLLKNEEKRRVLELFDSMSEQFNVPARGQALLIRNLLKDGVSFHHAGVLPAIKEILERLYTLGLIKLLFTTETFAVGINMPARAVIFHSLMKNDGISFRHLSAREFQQMAGRAGRRGIDEIGFAYACVAPRDANYEGIKKALSKDAEDIESQFSLSYSSILNLYDRFGDKIFEICEKSFNNYKTVFQVDNYKQKVNELSEDLESLRNTECKYGGFLERIKPYLELSDNLYRLSGKLKRRKKKGSGGKFLLQEKLKQIRTDMEEIECHECDRFKSCRNAYKRLKRFERDVEEIDTEMIEVENSQRGILQKRISFLKKLGYLDEKGLLPRGKIASQIFGYEIVFTELYFEGVFEEIDEVATNVLVSSIVFESRRGASYRKLQEKNIDLVMLHAEEAVRWLKKEERRADVPIMIKALDTKLNKAVYEWSMGCDFEKLKTFTSADEGDLVRSFRLIVDFLRQMKRAISNPAFRDKMDRCVQLLYRDVVDAEAQLKTELSSSENSQASV